MADLTFAQSAEPVIIIDKDNDYGVSLTFNLTPSGTESPVLLLKNPSGSGKTLSIKRFMMAGGGPIMRLYIDPTVTTNGTSQTPVQIKVGSGLPATVANVYSSSTISANGSRIASRTATSQSPFNDDLEESITIAPNHSLLVTGTPPSNNTSIEITLWWTEL